MFLFGHILARCIKSKKENQKQLKYTMGGENVGITDQFVKQEK